MNKNIKKYVNEREISANVIMDIYNDNQYNNFALKKALDNPELTIGQKKYITEIVNGVLRNQIYLECCINKVSKTPVDKMKSFIRALILTSAYEIIFMNNKPAFVCNEGVNLAKKKGFGALSGFVNGVLRSIGREYEQGGFEIEKTKDEAQYLSLKYSYPKWLVGYFRKYYGDKTEEICKFLNSTPKVTIAVNHQKTNLDKLTSDLKRAGMEVSRGSNFDKALVLNNTGNIARNNSFKKGEFWVMDESSQKAMDMIDFSELGQNPTILDLCSSPGGKSYFLKSKFPNSNIISCDIYDHKILLLENGYYRLDFDDYETIINDATILNKDFIDSSECVIVDAPCSGFGILRKKPDIKYNKTYDDIIALSEIQKDILDNAKLYTKENGLLVYSTCTLSYLENEGVINDFLEKNNNFELVTMETFIPSFKEANIKNGTESDGFFVSILRKVNNG